MRHNMRGRKFGMTQGHRRAMLANLAASLLTHEKIKTTLPKAKDLRPYVERLITLGKKGSLHARRRAIGILYQESVVSKLMGPLAERFRSRPGGYTRIIKAGYRRGDAAPMAIIELMDRPEMTADEAATLAAEEGAEGKSAEA